MSFIFLLPLLSGQRHTNLFKLAFEACKRRYPPKSILREVLQQLKHSNFPDKELRIVLKSEYERIINQVLPPKNALRSQGEKDKVTKVTKVTPVTFAEEQEAEEVYW